MEYYQRIKALREDHDLNQAKVAAQLGIDQSYYSKTGEKISGGVGAR